MLRNCGSVQKVQVLGDDCTTLFARTATISVLVSDTAYEQIRNRPEIEVAALESFRLKNVTRPLELYAVSGPDPCRARPLGGRGHQP